MSHAQRQCAGLQNSIVPNAISGTNPNTAAGAISGITGATQVSVIRIPVVVHLVYQTDAQNISDAQIKSGIAALNRDFRRQNSDTVNTPVRFKQLAADVEIEFELATSDPYGRATNGIERKRTTVKDWSIDDKIKYTANGGADGWNADQYLNIWIGNMPRSLGYSSNPGALKNVDGIVITTSAFGTLGKSGSYNMGRTLVHETGHWLGLKHIWGDADCGDDGISDTPPQGGFTSGCPNYFLSSCNNGTLGDMYMNYMDFTNDACMNLFTKGQKTKMRSLFNPGGLRSALLASTGLMPPSIEAIPIADNPPTQTPLPTTKVDTQKKAVMYPVPASSWLMVTLPDAGWIGKELRVTNISGTIVKRVVVNNLQQKILLQELSAGMYFLSCEANGSRMMEKFIKSAQ